MTDIKCVPIILDKIYERRSECYPEHRNRYLTGTGSKSPELELAKAIAVSPFANGRESEIQVSAVGIIVTPQTNFKKTVDENTLPSNTAKVHLGNLSAYYESVFDPLNVTGLGDCCKSNTAFGQWQFAIDPHTSGYNGDDIVPDYINKSSSSNIIPIQDSCITRWEPLLYNNQINIGQSALVNAYRNNSGNKRYTAIRNAWKSLCSDPRSRTLHKRAFAYDQFMYWYWKEYSRCKSIIKICLLIATECSNSTELYDILKNGNINELNQTVRSKLEVYKSNEIGYVWDRKINYELTECFPKYTSTSRINRLCSLDVNIKKLLAGVHDNSYYMDNSILDINAAIRASLWSTSIQCGNWGSVKVFIESLGQDEHDFTNLEYDYQSIFGSG